MQNLSEKPQIVPSQTVPAASDAPMAPDQARGEQTTLTSNSIQHPKMRANPNLVAICYCDFGCRDARNEEVVWVDKTNMEFGRSLDEVFDHFKNVYGGRQLGSTNGWRFWMEDAYGTILADTNPDNLPPDQLRNARTMQLEQNQRVREYHRISNNPYFETFEREGRYQNPFQPVNPR